MRTIKIENKELLDILDKKRKKSIEAKPILDRLQKIEDEHKELMEKMNTFTAEQTRNDEKARPFVRELLKNVEYGEFEAFERVSQDEETGNWNIVITDYLEEARTKSAEARNQLKEDLEKEDQDKEDK